MHLKFYRVWLEYEPGMVVEHYYWVGEGEPPSYNDFIEVFYKKHKELYKDSEEEINEFFNFIDLPYKEQDKFCAVNEEKYIKFTGLMFGSIAIPNLEDYGYKLLDTYTPKNENELQFKADIGIHLPPDKDKPIKEMRKLYGNKWTDAIIKYNKN